MYNSLAHYQVSLFKEGDRALLRVRDVITLELTQDQFIGSVWAWLPIHFGMKPAVVLDVVGGIFEKFKLLAAHKGIKWLMEGSQLMPGFAKLN